MKKSIIAILTVVLIILSNICAFAAPVIPNYTFVFPDGTCVNYMLDENQNPYHYVNGEKVYLALGLHHLEVTDENLLRELNKSLFGQTMSSAKTRAVPTNYVDLSQGSPPNNSSAYVKKVVFGTTSYIATPVIKFNSNHSHIRVKTTNLSKVNLFSSKNITFTYLYYFEYDDKWYSEYYENKNCTDAAGFGIYAFLSTYQYGRFYFWDEGNLNSYTANIWTTYA